MNIWCLLMLKCCKINKSGLSSRLFDVLWSTLSHLHSNGDTIEHAHALWHRADDAPSLMSSGARLDVVLDPNNPWGVTVGAEHIRVSSLPLNTDSAAGKTAPASNFDPCAARPLEAQGLRGLEGALAAEAQVHQWKHAYICVFVSMCGIF